MLAKPATLNAIQKEIQRKKFRVRNLGNMQDFLIAYRDGPDWMSAFSIDTNIGFLLNADRKQFVLLSTPEELESIKDMSHQEALQLFATRYIINQSVTT